MIASPNGRHAHKPVSEGISPEKGADVNGPTAVIKSCAKMDHLSTGGTLLNQKFTPSVVAGENGLEQMANLVRSYFNLDGHHIQFNVIDRQTLINAQKHPDEYRDLIVRVAGYSDHFRNLDKALQDEIIERTEQSFLLKNVREGSRQAAFSVIITKYEEVILMKKEYLYAGTSVLCFGTARLKAQTAFVINELWPALIILFSAGS